jgi:hypothetical protein
MTEVEWLACTDPEPMLELYRDPPPWRKLLLFNCACLCSIWELIPEGMARHAVEVAQQFADSLTVTPEFEELRAWLDNAIEGAFSGAEHPLTRVDFLATRAVFGFFRWCGHEKVGLDGAHYTRKARGRVAWRAMVGNGEEEGLSQAREAMEVERAEASRQCHLIREVFGNPFRPLTLDPAWLTPTVVSLAQAAYDNRILPAGMLEADRLAILADALEEAGCDSAEILNHLRQPGDHVRSCWVVDRLLGKE